MLTILWRQPCHQCGKCSNTESVSAMGQGERGKGVMKGGCITLYYQEWIIVCQGNRRVRLCARINGLSRAYVGRSLECEVRTWKDWWEMIPGVWATEGWDRLCVLCWEVLFGYWEPWLLFPELPLKYTRGPWEWSREVKANVALPFLNPLLL
jgi:hypothetical protein